MNKIKRNKHLLYIFNLVMIGSFLFSEIISFDNIKSNKNIELIKVEDSINNTTIVSTFNTTNINNDKVIATIDENVYNLLSLSLLTNNTNENEDNVLNNNDECIVNIEDIKEPEENIVNEEQIINTNNEEIEYLAKCVLAEAGNQDEIGKRLVIDVILNRVDSPLFPNTIIEVINQTNQFSVVTYGTIYTMELNDEILNLVKEELSNKYNDEVLYFRTNHYHEFGQPVLQHQDHYFNK